MASSSTYNLRPRQPLAPLPLSRFAPPSNTFPSPVSLPLKRNAPSSSSTSTLDSPGKMRKVSYTDMDGEETIKRARVKQITPQAKSLLERDDLGVGRSPARRLFVNEAQGRSYGISGAVSISQPSSPAASSSRSQRGLAASPPVQDRLVAPTSPILQSTPVNTNVDIHDPGFTILADATTQPYRSVFGMPTPDSKRNHTNNLAPDASLHIPSSPADSTTSYGFDDQENIPPVLSHSVTSTPSKSSLSSVPSSPSTKHSAASDWSVPGSRTRARSRLGETVIVGIEEDHDMEELTPGKRVLRKLDSARAKLRLRREVDRI